VGIGVNGEPPSLLSKSSKEVVKRCSPHVRYDGLPTRAVNQQVRKEMPPLFRAVARPRVPARKVLRRTARDRSRRLAISAPFDLYQRARYLPEQRNHASLPKAIEHLETAVASIRVSARLGPSSRLRSRRRQLVFDVAQRDRLRRNRPLQRAIELDPDAGPRIRSSPGLRTLRSSIGPRPIDCSRAHLPPHRAT